MHPFLQFIRALFAIAGGHHCCPYCGEYGGQPVELDDRDASTGYHGTDQRCTLCAGGDR